MLDESFLCHVFRIRGIPQVAGHQFHDLVLILAYQQIEGGLVALLDALDQPEITSVHTHLQA